MYADVDVKTATWVEVSVVPAVDARALASAPRRPRRKPLPCRGPV